jgi:hypothetical protein
MFQSFEVQDGTPLDIDRSERLWILGIAVSVVIALEMFDYSVMVVGPLRAALINVVLFGISMVLMVLVSRRRNGIARWLLVPLAALILFYDLSHFSEMIDRRWVAYLAVGRIGLMVAAIYFLFTPRSRAWFAGRPLPPGAEDEDWS